MIKHVPLRLSCFLLGALIALLLRLFANGKTSGSREYACIGTRMDTGCLRLPD